MNTQTLPRLRTGLLVLGMIIAICFAAIHPQAAYASVLPATTCSAAGIVRTCDLWAKTGTLTLPAGSVPASVAIWGYASDNVSPAGLPGPTLIAEEGETLEINLHNGLSATTSLSIRGLSGPSDTTGVGAGGTKIYTYVDLQPGTYLYEAGPTTNGERQVAMGMYGVLIVRPSGTPLQAYGPASTFDDEAVLVTSEIDPALNAAPTTYDLRNFSPKYFLFNGKAYPDTTTIDTNAGRKVLLRLVNAGLENHSIGVLGLRYTVLSIDGKPFAQPHTAVAETLSAGQTADVLVTMPASAPSSMKYAVYDSNLRLLNNGQGFGGMLTFLAIPAGGLLPDMTGPSSNSLLLTPSSTNGSVSVAFNATLSDVASGNGNIVAAEYFVGTTGASGSGTSMSGSFGSSTANVSATLSTGFLGTLSSGNHNIYIHGQDAAGNWGSFNFVTLNLDKQGPATGSLQATPNISNGSVNVALSGSANDTTTGNSNITAAEYFIDASGANGTGTVMTVNQAAPVASVTATLSAATVNALSQGNHQAFIHSRDAFGNWGAFTAVQFSVDKTGPAVSGLQLRPNPNNGTLAYSPSIQSVRLDANFSEPGAGPVTSTVANAEFFIDTIGANGTGVLMTPSDGLFNGSSESGYTYIPLITVKALAEGTHTLHVHAKDAAGNWGPFNTINLIVDKTAPSVSGLTLTPSASNNSSVAVSAATSDTATGNSNIAAGQYFIDALGSVGTGIAMTPGAASPSTNITANIPSATIAALAAGNHTIYVRSKDAAGNWSAATSATLLIDRTVPTFTSITLTPNSIASGTATVQVTLNGATDPTVSGLASGVVGGEYWFGSTNITAGTGTSFNGLVTNIPTASLTAGTYTVRTRVRDAAGNWSTNVRTATLTVISVQPALYFSTFGNSNPPGVGGTADNSDIYNYDGSVFSRTFDVTSAPYNLPALAANVDGFDYVDATHFYMSFSDAITVPGIAGTVQDEDVVYYNAGTWSLFFDGSANGLGGTDLDAISIVGGSLYFSINDTDIPPGAGGTGDDADIYIWNGGSSYTRIFDATVAGLAGSVNVDGFVRVDANHFYLSFVDNAVIPGPISVQDEDVVYYNNGVWSVYFDGTVLDLTSGNLDVDAFDLP